jgi:hypothetical protein
MFPDNPLDVCGGYLGDPHSGFLEVIAVLGINEKFVDCATLAAIEIFTMFIRGSLSRHQFLRR